MHGRRVRRLDPRRLHVQTPHVARNQGRQRQGLRPLRQPRRPVGTRLSYARSRATSAFLLQPTSRLEALEQEGLERQRTSPFVSLLIFPPSSPRSPSDERTNPDARSLSRAPAAAA